MKSPSIDWRKYLKSMVYDTKEKQVVFAGEGAPQWEVYKFKIAKGENQELLVTRHAE